MKVSTTARKAIALLITATVASGVSAQVRLKSDGMAVKSAGAVTLENVIVKSGGTLKIEAVETIVETGFEAHDGAEVEIMSRSN